jgi:hypothetical protein
VRPPRVVRRPRLTGLTVALVLATAALGSAVAGAGAASTDTGLDPSLLSLATFVAQQCTSAALAGNPVGANVCKLDAEQVGTDAYVYGIPLMEFERQAQQQTSVTVPNDLSDAPLNRLGSDSQLNSPQPGHQVFVQPNVDTLYTMGHLNLTAGPIVLHVPRVANHRYYVFQFLDPYTNTFAYVGTRTTGDGAGSYLITGPGWHGTVPKGVHQIRSSYERVWLCGRTLVNGARDLAAVHRIQKQYRLIPLGQFRRHGLKWKPPRPRRVITKASDPQVPTGLRFYSELGEYLEQNPPPAADAPELQALAKVGIGPGLNPAKAGLSAPVLSGLAEAADDGLAYITNERTTYAAESALAHDGWFVPGADTGNFGTDYEWRAIVAVYGLGANEPAEAMYIVGVIDQDDQKLAGGNDYVIHFAAGSLPPARYFWSLTMYDSDFSLVPNAINRYALANHIPGLRYNADSSLDIYLQHNEPAAAERSNWLPAPASGNFEVTLRLYGPQESALEGKYVYPTITSTP